MSRSGEPAGDELTAALELVLKTARKGDVQKLDKINQNYQALFDNMQKIIEQDRCVAESIFDFAERFRPMNQKSVSYVTGIKTYAENLVEDKIPTMQDALHSGDVELFRNLLVEMAQDFLPKIEKFQEIVDGYEELSKEADGIGKKAALHIHGAKHQERAAATGLAINCVALGATGTGGIALGAGVVGGVIAPGVVPGLLTIAGMLYAGCGVGASVCYASKCTHGQVVEFSQKVADLMLEIQDLVATHGKQLSRLRQGLEKISVNSKTMMKGIQMNRANKLLEAMGKDLAAVQEQCAEYEKTQETSEVNFRKKLGCMNPCSAGAVCS